MLDRTKVIGELAAFKERLFSSSPDVWEFLRTMWDRMCKDVTLQFRMHSLRDSFLIPGWVGRLNDCYPVSTHVEGYTIVAVDGSQIYPDRNMPGSGCCLINIAGIALSYGGQAGVKFINKPYLFLPDDLTPEGRGGALSKDLIDLKREELELKDALAFIQSGVPAEAALCLFDGSLIFWHLEAKNEAVRQLFLGNYLELLEQFYRNKTIIAGYISAPRSKEVLNVLCHELKLTPHPHAEVLEEVLHRLHDTSVLSLFLPPRHRTTLFWSRSPITVAYPAHLKPYFFYLNVGNEIARIEIPAWIAAHPDMVDKVAYVALNQSLKGNGYPLCLAEAHELAVVKNHDRDFFYNLIFKMNVEHRTAITLSQKSLKKRKMNV